MHPQYLPMDDKHFTVWNDYRPLLQDIGVENIHAIYHFPTRAQEKHPIHGWFNYKHHVVAIVDKDGRVFCAMPRLHSKDKYNAKHGFRLAVRQALGKMYTGRADFRVVYRHVDTGELMYGIDLRVYLYEKVMKAVGLDLY